MTSLTSVRGVAARASAVAAITLLAACGSGSDTAGGADESAAPAPVASDPAAAPSEPDGDVSAADPGAIDASTGCAPADLETLTPGTLTFATSEPAFEPWMVDDDPTNGEGYEAAVAYAVAEQLGYREDGVTWVRTPFEAAIAPGPKDFDVAVNQFSITDERRQAVDFSAPYYDVRQAVVAVEGSAAADATSLADLAGVLFGAQVGTTSLEAVQTSVQPSQDVQVFNSNEDAKLALDNGQIDALVVDLPTAFYLTAVEIEGGVIVGQLPEVAGGAEQFGMVLDLGSPLTDCISGAVESLEADGTLDELAGQWLADVAGAPELG